jgi:hypothetical protein
MVSIYSEPMKFLSFLKKQKKVEASVNVTSVNIKWLGEQHTSTGFQVMENPFQYELPFQNKSQLKIVSFLPAQEQMPMRIKEVSVKAPFALDTLSPKLPIALKNDEKVVFKMRIRPPDYNYEGPLGIEVVPDKTDTIHVEITDTLINAPGSAQTKAQAKLILNVPKMQVFMQKINVPQLLVSGATISKIEVSKPFNIVGSEPKAPFKITEGSGHIVTLYLQAPDFNYAGPIEITMS